MISSKIGTRMFTHSWSLVTSATAALVLTAALISGCQTPPAAPAEPNSSVASPGQSAAGSVSIALVVPPNFQIDTISYQLTKAGFSQAGDLNVAQSGAVSGVLGGIPAGTGYTLALAAVDVGKKFTSCAGSSTLAVTGGATTPVSVNIDCRLPPLVTPPPSVPVPMSAILLLAFALLASGAAATRQGGRRAPNRPSDAPPPERR